VFIFKTNASCHYDTDRGDDVNGYDGC